MNTPITFVCLDKQRLRSSRRSKSVSSGGIGSITYPLSVVSNISRLILVIEQKGSTLHLLKLSSKPVTQVRKRKKLSIFGEQPIEQEMIDLGAMREELKGADTFDQIKPNIIGNLEDKQSSGSMISSFKAPIDPNQNGVSYF